MALKIAYGIIAAVLVITYLMAPLVKLKDVALGTVILIGIVMMLLDLWQSLQSKEE